MMHTLAALSAADDRVMAPAVEVPVATLNPAAPYVPAEGRGTGVGDEVALLMMLTTLNDPLTADPATAPVEPPTPDPVTCSHAENVIPVYPVDATHQVALDEDATVVDGSQFKVPKWIAVVELPATVIAVEL